MIHSTAVVDAGARIGERTRIGAHAVIDASVTIGADCIIDAGAIIGGVGFGYTLDDDGNWHLRDHPFRVIIGDNVHVGSGCVIHRGRRRDTIIRDGCRIAPLVHIAHNCQLGENTVVITGSILNGSTMVGHDAYIGANATTREGSMIGENAILGMGSVLLGNIPAGETWAGTPARPIRTAVVA